MPIGAAVGGQLAALVGIRPVLAGAAVLTLSLLVPVARFITPANLRAAERMPQPRQEPVPVAPKVEPDLLVEGGS
jgi:hypothetical protein